MDRQPMPTGKVIDQTPMELLAPDGLDGYLTQCK